MLSPNTSLVNCFPVVYSSAVSLDVGRSGLQVFCSVLLGLWGFCRCLSVASWYLLMINSAYWLTALICLPLDLHDFSPTLKLLPVSPTAHALTLSTCFFACACMCRITQDALSTESRHFGAKTKITPFT